MPSFVTISRNNNRYLIRCDFLNKYNLKSIVRGPSLKKITIDFPLEDIFTRGVEQIKSEILIKNFLNLYCLTGVIPYISFKGRVKNASKKYSLKIFISKTSKIENFLGLLFTENYVTLKRQEFRFFRNQPRTKNHFLVSNNFSYNLKVPTHTFVEMDEFLSFFDPENISKEIPLYINFSFENPLFGHLSNSSHLFKNVEPFWTTD